MKTLMNIIGCIVLIMTQVFLICEKSSADNNWKNFYGVAWTGTPADNIKYAKQMGHDYIVLQQYYSKSTYMVIKIVPVLSFILLTLIFGQLNLLGMMPL